MLDTTKLIEKVLYDRGLPKWVIVRVARGLDKLRVLTYYKGRYNLITVDRKTGSTDTWIKPLKMNWTRAIKTSWYNKIKFW